MINRLSERQNKSKNIHRDLGKAQRSADENALKLVSNWLEEMRPFDGSNPEDILLSFSTGFMSKSGNGINPEKACVVGRGIQLKLDGKTPTEKLDVKSKVKSLAELRKDAGRTNSTTNINALKCFNRLVIFAQRESDLNSCLASHEMTPIPMPLFSEKDQLMLEGDKATFAKNHLKNNVNPVEMKTGIINTYVVDGGKRSHSSTTADKVLSRYEDKRGEYSICSKRKISV